MASSWWPARFDGPDTVPIATTDPYLAIGHSLLALLAAGLGGVLASFLFGPRRVEANVVASAIDRARSTGGSGSTRTGNDAG